MLPLAEISLSADSELEIWVVLLTLFAAPSTGLVAGEHHAPWPPLPVHSAVLLQQHLLRGTDVGSDFALHPNGAAYDGPPCTLARHIVPSARFKETGLGLDAVTLGEAPPTEIGKSH